MWGPLPGDDWCTLESNHSSYEPLEWARNNSYSEETNEVQALLTTVMQVRYLEGCHCVKLTSEWNFIKFATNDTDFTCNNDYPLFFQDRGDYDGIQRIIFGSGLRFWLHRLLFLDSLSYLSHGQLSINLDRLILIDVDDIFVGEKGTRLRPDDVLVSCRARRTRIFLNF